MRSSHRVSLRRAIVAFALLLGSRTAAAQVIRGTVVSEGAGAPVRGAVVTLLTSTGADGGRRVLTDNDGAFAMRAPGVGSWMIEVRAIGYAPRRTTAKPVGTGETTLERIQLRQVATRLATLRIEARSACRRASELDAVTTEVWDDVWAALAAAQLAREQRLVRAEVFVFTREVDVSTSLVMLEERGRVRQQQELLREINSRIAGIDWTSAENDTVDFHCECGASDCVGTVSLTPNEYTSLRQKGLVIREGHETPPVLDQGPTISYAHAERAPRRKPTPLPES